ncbi:MAG: prepilin peptidase, partial [Gammaproteobacteria bacterium]|nr:prepilin peptidase [Gammaproteobacteria bacterium]
MDLAALLSQSPGVLIGVAFALGLIAGSFLNVVAHRLPLMLERAWRRECAELLEDSPATQDAPFNLVVPRSRCPACGHAVRARENVPVLSYLLLRGRCSACGARISVRYPVVEATAGALAAIVAWRFGLSWETGAALLFTWALIGLTVIDLDHKLLPDDITLPLLWLGLIT